jgi:hypothetical protein
MKMRAVAVGFMMSALLGLSAQAEDNRWEVAAFGGRHFTGHLDLAKESGSDQLDLTDGAAYGVAIGRDWAEDSSVELMWTRQDSHAHARGGSAAAEDLGSVSIDRYMFNGLYYPPQAESRARWFVLGGLGAAVFSPEGSYGTSTQFAMSLGGGTKIRITNHLGLRLDARWSPTFFSSDSSVVCASSPAGGGCAVAESGQLLSQMELTAGLFVRL